MVGCVAAAGAAASQSVSQSVKSLMSAVGLSSGALASLMNVSWLLYNKSSMWSGIKEVIEHLIPIT